MFMSKTFRINKKITLFLAGLLGIISIGSIGYQLIEKMSFLDSIYMSIITITTVGYKEVHPLTPQGKIFTIFYIILGIAFVSYIAVNLGEYVFENALKDLFGKRRSLSNMKNHYIVCGIGRIGSIVAREFHEKNKPFVVIERDSEKIRQLEEKGFPFIEGDATEEETLLRANIKQAKGIACALSEDADNLYVALMAKELNPEITIVSRAEHEHSVRRLLKAGVQKVVTPYEEGALKIAEYLISQESIEIVDFFVNAEQLQYAIKPVTIGKNSGLAGKTIREAGLRNKYGILIIGIKGGRQTLFSPSPDEKLREDDILLVIGEAEKLSALKI